MYKITRNSRKFHDSPQNSPNIPKRSQYGPKNYFLSFRSFSKKSKLNKFNEWNTIKDSVGHWTKKDNKIIFHLFINHNFGFEFCDNLFICKSSFYGNYELKKKLQTIDIYLYYNRIEGKFNLKLNIENHIIFISLKYAHIMKYTEKQNCNQ
jgi:hypothetical protein